MFLKLFRSQYIFQIIIFLLISMMLWIDGFISIEIPTESSPLTPFYSLVFIIFKDLKIVSVFLAFLILIFEAFYINKILSDNKLIPRNTVLPAFIFFILMSFNPHNLTLNPILLSLIFIIPAIKNILDVYDKKIAYIEIFNAAVLFSLASFFYFPATGYLLIIYMGLYIYRIFKWREWLIPLVGFSLPYVFLFVYYFLFDQHNFYIEKYAYFLSHNIGLNFALSDKMNDYFLIISVFVSLILSISLTNIISKINEKVITHRKRITLILNLFLVSSFTFFYRDNYLHIQKMLFIFPITFIFSLHFSNIKRTFINELIFTLLVVSLLAGKIFIA